MRRFGKQIHWVLAIAAVAAAGFACGGCKSSESYEDRYGLAERFKAPQPPAFINGAIGLLLTNVEVFSCHAVMQGASGFTESGELFGRNGKLLFAVEPDKSTGKRLREGGFSFIWDVREGKGFVMSDPLQGVAPLSAPQRFTNWVARPVTGATAQKIEAYLCEPESVVVAGADGSASIFQVWRARDARNFPIKITSGEGAAPLSISFSRVKFEAPPMEAFTPPEAFTKYATSESLVNEYVSRQQQSRGFRRPISSDYGSELGITPR